MGLLNCSLLCFPFSPVHVFKLVSGILMDSNWLLPLFATFPGLTLVTVGYVVTQAMEDGFADTDALPVFFLCAFLFFSGLLY